MKLKKAGALGLSCVIALGSMAGCGSSKEKEKTDGKEEISGEIRYAFWDTAQQPYFEKCIEKFNEQYPDVKVTLEPSSLDEYWTKLEAGATGGSANYAQTECQFRYCGTAIPFLTVRSTAR